MTRPEWLTQDLAIMLTLGMLVVIFGLDIAERVQQYFGRGPLVRKCPRCERETR
jgi:hypothetical protein